MFTNAVEFYPQHINGSSFLLISVVFRLEEIPLKANFRPKRPMLHLSELCVTITLKRKINTANGKHIVSVLYIVIKKFFSYIDCLLSPVCFLLIISSHISQKMSFSRVGTMPYPPAKLLLCLEQLPIHYGRCSNAGRTKQKTQACLQITVWGKTVIESESLALKVCGRYK